MFRTNIEFIGVRAKDFLTQDFFPSPAPNKSIKSFVYRGLGKRYVKVVVRYFLRKSQLKGNRAKDENYHLT